MRAARLKRLLVCVVALTACGPKKTTPPPRTLPEAGDLLAHVSDPSGAPVASAIFDGVAAFTDRFHTHMWSRPDDVCVQELSIDNWLTWTDSYTTQLHKGFLGPSAPSLAEMLTEGHRSVNPLGRGEQGISGFETVPVEAQPDVWPFTRMHVAWHFFQVTPPQ